MPADLDQFGREYSYGAVIGGKGLVELGHMAANGGCFVHQIDLETRSSEVKRGLDPADPSTDNHDITIMTSFETLANAVCKALTNLVFDSLKFSFHFPSPHQASSVPASVAITLLGESP
jgi:hypothetical protein